MMKAFCIVAMAVTLASPAWAVDNPVSPSQDKAANSQAQRDKGDSSGDTVEASQQANDPNKVICRRQEVVGTRLAKKRICATAAEWERIHAEERQATERIQNQRSKSN